MGVSGGHGGFWGSGRFRDQGIVGDHGRFQRLQDFLKDHGDSRTRFCLRSPGISGARKKNEAARSFPILSCSSPALLSDVCVLGPWAQPCPPAWRCPKPQTLTPVGAQNVLAGAAQGMGGGGAEDRTLHPLSSCLAGTPSSDCAPKVLQCQRIAGTAQSPGTVLPKPESGSVASPMPCPAICAAADEV